jgi:hypothetical protein
MPAQEPRVVADINATGRWAGQLLAQNLIDLVDGLVPLSSPVGGVGRDEGATQFTGVHFPDGNEVFHYMTARPGPVRRWIARDSLVDAVLIRHLAEKQELHVLLPWCDGRDWFEIVVWFAYSVTDGAIAISMPEWQTDPTTERRRHHELLDAMDAGISSHPRARELEAGWGALGCYRYRGRERGGIDPRVYATLVELGKTRGRHRLWRGAVTDDELEHHLDAVGVSVMPRAPHVDALGEHGIALVHEL